MRTNNNAIARFLNSNRTATLQLKAEKVDLFPWDAPVHAERLFTAGGVDANRFGIVATPSLESGFSPRVVGSYSKGETLLSNLDAVTATENALEKCGFEYTREIRLVRDGGGIEIVYTIHNYPVTVGHSQGKPQVKLRNSYDGKWKFQGSFSLLMLVCLNGLFTLKEVECLSQKHSSKLNIQDMADRFVHLVESGVESARSFERLADYPIEDDMQAATIFGNVSRISKGSVSKRAAAEMFAYYMEPDTAEQSLSPSLWRAYMAGTRMARDLATVRPTVSNEVNSWLGQIFGLVVDKGNTHFGDVGYLTRALPASLSILEIEID